MKSSGDALVLGVLEDYHGFAGCDGGLLLRAKTLEYLRECEVALAPETAAAGGVAVFETQVLQYASLGCRPGRSAAIGWQKGAGGLRAKLLTLRPLPLRLRLPSGLFVLRHQGRGAGVAASSAPEDGTQIASGLHVHHSDPAEAAPLCGDEPGRQAVPLSARG
jgi:hypothetical protein